MREKFAWALALTLGLAVLAAFAGVVRGGPLDPPSPPSSTMKTLDEIPGSWHRLLSIEGSDPCSTERFQCVMGDQAVLDHETGLVWQRTPDGTLSTWDVASNWCVGRFTGGRHGWRLPTINELMTLVESGWSLPSNHPFVGVDTATSFWSSTPSLTSPTAAWGVHLNGAGLFYNQKTNEYRFWCVRGGHFSSDPQ